MTAAQVTIATSTKPNRLTKRWHIVDGKPTKEHAGELSEGSVKIQSATCPTELVEILEHLEANQALIFGLPPAEHCPVVTRTNLPKAPPGAIARTADAFTWNAGPGWLLLDCDPPPTGEPLSREQLLELLFEVAPAMANAPMVWGVSGSSCIYNSRTGEQVTGIRGQRLYVLVADARDITRAGKALFDRLWLAGHGYYLVSKSGQLLKRSAIDSSVWQTNRLDFAAPPECIAPLEARRPSPEPLNNDASPLTTSEAIPDLSKAEAVHLTKLMDATCAVADLQVDVRQTRDAWVTERLKQLKDLPEEQREEARQRLTDVVEKCRLFGDFELIHSSGERVFVRTLLDNPETWHGERFHDPLEPDYSNSDNRIAYANLRSGGVPFIYSHAHGGIRYRLLRPVQVLKLQQGELPQVLPKILERLRVDGEIFERAGILVRLADGELMAAEKAWLQTHLESAFQFQAFDSRAGKWLIKDCPDKLVARLMAARGTWGLPKVGAVVAFPVMRPDGSVIEKPGFDESTGLLYLDMAAEKTPMRPLTRQALSETLIRIWHPFKLFPFDGAISRGVFMAALLTTVCRPALATAPAFLVRASTPGTGKTLLSECLMLLVGASLSALPLPEGNQDEIEKRLFAKLLTGCPGLILDNLVGVINSAAMCAFLTSPEPEGRILGQSETRSVVNRSLWLLNGNNVTAGGDMFRRILPITLDANCESPETRRFTFNPKTVIRERLDAYRADLLSVLLTYQREGGVTLAAGSFGSFEDWERLVRQCVCWLIRDRVAPEEMSDPLEAMTLNKAEDPQRQQHAAVLEAWFGLYADKPVQVRDIVKLVEAGVRDTTQPAVRAFVELVSEIKPLIGGFNSQHLSGWLRKHKGRVLGGYRLDAGDQSLREPGWLVTQAF